MHNVEFKVKPVTRYIVTKYSKGLEETTVINCGEFDNHKKANIVCEALWKTHCLETEEAGIKPSRISCDTYNSFLTVEGYQDFSKDAQDLFEKSAGKYLGFPLDKYENGSYICQETSLALKVFTEGYKYSAPSNE